MATEVVEVPTTPKLTIIPFSEGLGREVRDLPESAVIVAGYDPEKVGGLRLNPWERLMVEKVSGLVLPSKVAALLTLMKGERNFLYLADQRTAQEYAAKAERVIDAFRQAVRALQFPHPLQYLSDSARAYYTGRQEEVRTVYQEQVFPYLSVDLPAELVGQKLADYEGIVLVNPAHGFRILAPTSTPARLELSAPLSR